MILEFVMVLLLIDSIVFNHLKTQKACQYLQFTDLRVNEIADRLGIEDPYYFSRMFTKIVGVSPNKYRGKRRLNVESR